MKNHHRAPHGANQWPFQGTPPRACPGMVATVRWVTMMLMASIPRMNLTFLLVNEIALRISLSSQELKGYVAGSLTVDMNPDTSINSAVFTANARSSNAQVFNTSTVCLTQFENKSEIMIRVRIVRFVDWILRVGSSLMAIVRYLRGRTTRQIPYKWIYNFCCLRHRHQPTSGCSLPIYPCLNKYWAISHKSSSGTSKS